MRYVDSVVLDLTERVCRSFQRLTGRSNVWIAVQLTNLSIIVYFVWAGAYLWRSDLPTRIVLGVFCTGLLYTLTQTVLKVPVEAAEQSAYLRVARGLRNPRRVRDSLLRILFLTLAIVLAGPVWLVHVVLHLPLALLTYSLIALTTSLLYVLACDPLPPCQGRVVEWMRGMRSAGTSDPAAVSNAPSRRLRGPPDSGRPVRVSVDPP